MGEADLVAGVNAHHRSRHEGYSPGNHVAVSVELVKGLVAELEEVQAHAVDHVPEGLDVEGELRDGVREGCVEDVVWPAVEESLQALLPSVQGLEKWRARQAELSLVGFSVVWMAQTRVVISSDDNKDSKKKRKHIFDAS